MKYKPINCNFYDELEAFATLKKNVSIVANVEGEETTLKGYIKDFKIIHGAEYLIMENGTDLRLDRITSVQVI